MKNCFGNRDCDGDAEAGREVQKILLGEADDNLPGMSGIIAA